MAYLAAEMKKEFSHIAGCHMLRVFAIACTLLVIEIHIPHFKSGLSLAEQWHEFSELIPSLIGFGFSFLNILVFWT